MKQLLLFCLFITITLSLNASDHFNSKGIVTEYLVLGGFGYEWEQEQPLSTANYQFRECRLSPAFKISRKGELQASIQGLVINYGNQKAKKLQLELTGDSFKKQQQNLSTAPQQQQFSFLIPFKKAAKMAISGKPFNVVLNADGNIVNRSVKPESKELLIRLFRPIQIPANFIETSLRIHCSEFVKIPKILSQMTLVLQHSANTARVQINGKKLEALASATIPQELITADNFKLYSLPANKNKFSYELSYSKEEMKAEKIAPKLWVINPDYLKLVNNIEYAEILAQKGFALEKLACAELLNAFLSGKKKNIDKQMTLANAHIKKDSQALKANTIYMVGNSHIDLAWLWPWTETVDVCKETFENALDLMEACPDFTYAQSQAQTYLWMEQYYPELFKRIKKMVKAGKWIIVNGMWTEPDSNLPSGEAFVRQILYGQRYFKEKFGVTTNVAWTPDTFGYAWTLPQIYKKAGFDYFVTTKIGRNDITKPKHHLFMWEAPDGSQIMTFLPQGYGSSPNSSGVLNQFQRYQKNTKQNDLMILYGKSEHGGGPTKEMLNNINAMAKVDYFPTVKFSTPAEYFEAITASETKLPVVRDEMYLEYHRGCYTTQAKVKKYNRQIECLLETAEKFAGFSGLPYPEKELDDAWKRTLFNQFHDILPGSSIPLVYEHAHAAYDTAITATKAIINAAFEAIAKKVDTYGYGSPIIVFNPLSWQRNDVVTVDLPKRLAGKHLRVTDEDSWVVKSQRIKGNKLIFEVNGVPPVGYKVYFLQVGKTRIPKDRPVAKEWKIKSSNYEIQFDEKTGDLKSIFDRRQKRELLVGAGNELQFFEDIPSEYDAWNIGYTGKSWGSKPNPKMEIIENGAVRATIRVTRATDSSKFTQDISLYRSYPVIEFRTHVDWHESHVLAKAGFKVAVRNEMATYEIPYGTIQRTTMPKTAADSAKYEVSAHKWIDLTDRKGDYGVSLLNDCKYGFDIRGNTLRITLLRSPKSPDPNADMGEHTFTYSLYPHSGDWRTAETYQRAYELNYPLQAFRAKKQRGKLPKTHSFIRLEGAPGVVLTAVKKAEDTDELIIRLVEIFGKTAAVNLHFQDSIARVRAVNLIEEPVPEEIVSNDKIVSLRMKPFEIKSIAVQLRFQVGALAPQHQKRR